jgi:transcription antitermination factor NusG
MRCGIHWRIICAMFCIAPAWTFLMATALSSHGKARMKRHADGNEIKKPLKAGDRNDAAMAFWSVVQTYAMREASVAIKLVRDGFETYLPKIREIGPDGRGRNVPLFPGYVFVQIERIWYPVLSCVGVIRLLRNGDEPCRLDDSIVTKLHGAEVKGLVRLPKPRGLQPGDQVKITRGMFRDHIGIFEGMKGRQRTLVLLALLGRQVTVEIPSDDVMPVVPVA